MACFLKFSKLRLFASRRPNTGTLPVSPATINYNYLEQETRYRKEHCCRLSAYTVRVTVGNEMTDYQLPYQPGEVLWAVDYNRQTPIAKFIGRFKGGKFTGLKYNYSHFFEDNQLRQYVESITEYREGSPHGVQVYFDVRGDVIRRAVATPHIAHPTQSPVPPLHATS